MRRSSAGVLWCAVLLACAPAASVGQQQAAKDYPSKPIRVVVPFVPGGPMDFIGYGLGQKIAPVIGQNLVIDHRPGAGGAIGADVVAKSPRDGYTILLTSSSLTTLPSVVKSLPYDPVKDFTPITLVSRSPGFVLVVHPSLPARSVKELVALAKANPGKLSYPSAGIGHVLNFAGESFNMRAGTRIVHVPYKGIGQAINDLLAGRIELGLVSARSVLAHVRSGKLRPLGITASVRWNELPGVPTLDEAGLKGFTYATWYGLWYPAGTPVDYVPRMRGEVVRAFEDPATKRTFVEQGLIPVVSTPQEFGKTILEELEFHRRLAAQMGLKPQ